MGKTRNKSVKVTVNCKFCEIKFETTEYRLSIGKDKFCSKKCFSDFQKEFHIIKCKCEYCETEYTVNKYQYEKGTRFCSIICRNKWESMNKRGSGHHNYKKLEVTCSWCGNNYMERNYKVTDVKSTYLCSIECRQEWYAKEWSQTKEWKEESKKRAAKLLSDGVYKHTNTKCQIVINEILDKLKIIYTNEANFVYYTVDNYLYEFNLIIEVMGTYWHSDPRVYNYENMNKTQINRTHADKRKNSYLRNNHGINILYLWEHDIHNNPNICELLILEYIKNQGNLKNYHSFNYTICSENSLKLLKNKMNSYFE